jgi:hypothetical protein
MALRDLPRERFPLHWDTYSRIYDELIEAGRRFYDLGYPDLATYAEQTLAALKETWNAIVAAERAGR